MNRGPRIIDERAASRERTARYLSFAEVVSFRAIAAEEGEASDGTAGVATGRVGIGA